MNKVEQYMELRFESALEEQGFELVDIAYEKENGTFFLRFFLDRLAPDEHISLDDCERMNRYIGEILDEEEADVPIKNAYRLEVSSPGIERPLRRVKDFKRFVDETIELRFYRAIEGQKKCQGRLISATDEEIVLKRNDGHIFNVSYKDIAKANLYFEF